VAGDEEDKRGGPGLHLCLQKDPEEPWVGAGDVWADAVPSERLGALAWADKEDHSRVRRLFVSDGFEIQMGNFTLFGSFEREIGFGCLFGSAFLTGRLQFPQAPERGRAGKER